MTRIALALHCRSLPSLPKRPNPRKVCPLARRSDDEGISLITAAAVLGRPSAAQAQDTEKKRSAEYSTKKICRTYGPIGTRPGSVKRCRTRAQQAQHREVMERVQSEGNMLCRLPETGRGCSW